MRSEKRIGLLDSDVLRSNGKLHALVCIRQQQQQSLTADSSKHKFKRRRSSQSTRISSKMVQRLG